MGIVFLVQGLAGVFMLLYYVPLPDQAYSSTVYVFKNVPLGQLIETLHLYGAYAMILLAFMHLMRNYFANVHKKPRELMWVAGMLLGFVLLGFGLTGYLLPWTVVSKSGTDVTIGMLGCDVEDGLELAIHLGLTLEFKGGNIAGKVFNFHGFPL